VVLAYATMLSKSDTLATGSYLKWLAEAIAALILPSTACKPDYTAVISVCKVLTEDDKTEKLDCKLETAFSAIVILLLNEVEDKPVQILPS